MRSTKPSLEKCRRHHLRFWRCYRTSSASEAECPDRLTPLQHLQTLLHGLLRFDAEGGIVIVGKRMGNHDKRIAWHAADVRHGLRRMYKPVRDDRRGRDAGFFRRYRIVQTTR